MPRQGQPDALASALLKDSRPERALAVASALRERQRDGSQPNDWQTANTLLVIGSARRRLGDSAAAEAALTESAQLIVRTFGREFVSYWQNLAERIDLLVGTGREPAAMALIDSERRLLESLQRDVVPEGETALDPSVISENLALLTGLKARLLVDRGDCGPTARLLSEAIPSMAVKVEVPLLTDDARVILADCLLLSGDPPEALRELDLARSHYAMLTSYHEAALIARERWAEVQLRHGDPAIADAAVAELKAVLAAADDRPLPVVAAARMTLAEQAIRSADRVAARQWATQSAQALSRMTTSLSARVTASLRDRQAAIMAATGGETRSTTAQ